MAEPSDSDLYAQGNRVFEEVYAGDLTPMPEGTMAFNDVMIKSLFAQVWNRDVLRRRDTRLLVMGVCAARGATDAWKIQARSALKNEELTADELRETLIVLAQYAGYPPVSSLVLACEEVIHGVARETRNAAEASE